MHKFSEYLTEIAIAYLKSHEGLELSEFAALVLLETEEGRETLQNYYRKYADIAQDKNFGFILESATWRANRDWGEKLGYTTRQLADVNRASVKLLEDIRDEYQGAIPHMVISGCSGPRDDGYSGDMAMKADEAVIYHRTQIAIFRETEADMVAAYTIPYIAEGISEIPRSAQVNP